MRNANPVSTLALALLLAVGGCEREREAVEPPKPASHYFPLSVGSRIVDVQLAVTEPEMARGLMHRRDLGPDQGMLFVYDAPQRMSFWMRNTPTPLHIGFFTSDGVLREFYPLHPFDERTVSSRRDDLQYALEVRRGWFERTGVRLGDRLDLTALGGALKARGFDPRRFGAEVDRR